MPTPRKTRQADETEPPPVMTGAIDRDQLLAALAANMPGTLFYRSHLRRDGRLTYEYVSPNVEQALGVTAAAIRQDAALLYGRIIPEDQSEWLTRIQRAAATGETLEYTARVRMGDGSVRWFQLRSRLASVLPDGTQVRDGIATDIQALKETEARLREQADTAAALQQARAIARSERQLKEAQAIAHLGHWEWDVRTRAHVWSDEIYRIYGLEPQSVVITDDFFVQHMHPQDRQRMHEAMLSALESPRPFNLDYRIVRDDGSIRHLHDEEVPIFDAAGRLTHYRGTSQDVTAAKQTEQVLRANEQRLEEIFRAVGEGLVVQDATGKIIQCNEAALRILGVREDELLQRTSHNHEWEAIRADGSPYPGSEHPAMVTLRTGVPSRDQVMGLRRPDGRRIWISINSEPLHDSTGEVYAVVTSFSDITQQRLYERQLTRQVRYLDALARVNRCSLQAANTEEMLQSMLDVVLEIFQADRAWFLSPCNPHVASWSVPIERTRPEWPGAFAAREQIPMTPEIATVFAELLATPEAIGYGPGQPREVPPSVASRFGVRSQIMIAIRPRIGEAWVFGLHHCARACDYDTEETKLFSDIAQRITDSLSSLAAQQGLRDSEERFRGLFHHSPVPMVVASFPGGKVLDFNSALTSVYGYTREHTIGRTTGELQFWVRADDRERFLSVLQQAGFVDGFEADMRRSNGETAPTLLHCTVINYDGQRCSLVTMIDISAQRDALAQLRRTELQFQDLFEFAPDATVMVDQRGRITRVNQRAEQLFGYQRHELLGQSIEILVPEAKRGTHAHSRGAYSEHATPRAMGERNAPLFARRKDGGIFPAEISLGPIKSASGLVVAAAIRDATPMIEAEKQRREAETRLRQAQKMESLGTLAGGIAHDFNNILTGLLGFVELARHDLSPAHPSRHWLDNISLSGARAKELVRQILTFSHKHESDRVPLRLQGVIREALGLLRSTLPPMVTIEEHIDASCPPVLADGTQIHQVIMNLCTNAWHALPESGGCITLGLENCTFTARQQVGHRMMEPGAAVRLTVQDNGAGMEPAVLERIFEPFFTTKPTGQGTGLGLSVVHGIVESHQGAIAVRSTPGQGTTFELYFPSLVGGAAAPDAPDAQDTLPRGRGQRILLVDDDPAAGAALSGVIRLLGYHVAYHQSPRAALTHFLEDPGAYDLLLTDFAMPGMPGVKLAQAARERRPDLPVLLISGYIDPRRTQELQGAGIREILGKPPAREELAAALDRCVRR